MQPEDLIERMKNLGGLWNTNRVHDLLCDSSPGQSLRSSERLLESLTEIPQAIGLADLCDEDQRPLRTLVVESLQTEAKKKRHHSWVLQTSSLAIIWL